MISPTIRLDITVLAQRFGRVKSDNKSFQTVYFKMIMKVRIKEVTEHFLVKTIFN